MRLLAVLCVWAYKHLLNYLISYSVIKTYCLSDLYEV